MLKVILNRLKPQAEEIIAKEQAGFRAGRSTTEQIFNLRILCEKYFQHQQNLYHVFIDFKKAFDRVWHAALGATVRKYNISANLVRTIEQLYDKATSAVQMNGSIGEWFRTLVGVRQGCLLSPSLFNIFLERIMSDALEEHDRIQQNLYHVFIDFKKAFDRVRHAALWATVRKYNISANLVRTIEQLYDKATSAVQMNGSIGEWFRTTVGVRQGCLLSPSLFNIFLERIMSDALEEHDGKVSIGGRNITNLRFADGIDALAEEEQGLEALVESFEKTRTRYEMEISAE